MTLDRKYSEEFERLWKAYPNWPQGRSKKHLAYQKWLIVRKEDGITNQEFEELLLRIEEAKRYRVSWQKGDRYGPQALQVWLNQRGWSEDYPRVRKASERVGPDGSKLKSDDERIAESRRRADEAEAKQRGMTVEELHNWRWEQVEAMRK